METLPRLKNTLIVISESRQSLSDYEYRMLCDRKFCEAETFIYQMIGLPNSRFFNAWVYGLKNILYQMLSTTNKGMCNDRERKKDFCIKNYSTFGKPYDGILIGRRRIDDDEEEMTSDMSVTVDPEKFDDENNGCLTAFFEGIADLTSLKVADLLGEIDNLVDIFAYAVRKKEDK